MSATNRQIIIWGKGAGEAPPDNTVGRQVSLLRRRDEVETLRKRYSEVTSLAARLIEECRRLRADNEDLRGSAEIWIGMYERQLERANTLEEQSRKRGR
jgi:hypothetical protein